MHSIAPSRLALSRSSRRRWRSNAARCSSHRAEVAHVERLASPGGRIGARHVSPLTIARPPPTLARSSQATRRAPRDAHRPIAGDQHWRAAPARSRRFRWQTPEFQSCAARRVELFFRMLVLPRWHPQSGPYGRRPCRHVQHFLHHRRSRRDPGRPVSARPGLTSRHRSQKAATE